jgi:hypothetical protein
MERIFSNVRYDALRNAIYHTERKTFFDLLNRIINFSVIVLGAGVVAKGTQLFDLKDVWLELCVVFFATAQLVFDFGSRARTHEFLQKRYYEILADMEQEDALNRRTDSYWGNRLLTIAADEPMPMRALDALADNKAFDALVQNLDERKKNRLVVPWVQRRLRHFFAFQGAAYKTEQQIQQKKFLARCWARFW